MSEYPSLAALRSGLTTDDADERGRAYSSVMGIDVQPSAVLESDPSEDTVETLVENDVIPADRTGGERRPAAQMRAEQLELLKEIRDILKGGA